MPEGKVMSETNAGSIYFDVEMDTAKLLTGARQVDSALDDLSSSSKSAGKAIENLSKENKSASSTLNQIASSTKSVDGSMQTLNTTVSAMALAIQQANASSAAASMTLAQMNGAMNSLIGAANSIAEAMKSAGSGTSAANSEFNRSETIIEGLGNQLAILDEAQENGARSAAILAAQLRAGSAASDAEKAKIGELTGQLYDMKNGTDSGAKSHGNWKNSMQQAGYQVQDFIVQVQGGQSALVAFAQQGSQLAGAFGPQGAIVGALIALGSVIVGTLIKSMGDAEDTLKTLSTAIQDFDNVVSVSNQGVATLSDKYALLAQTNMQAATIMRNQAAIELQSQLANLPQTLDNVSDSTFSFGDTLKATFTGGLPSISLMNGNLKSLGVTTDNYNEALSQLAKDGGGRANQVMIDTASTTETLAQKFNISNDEAFRLAQQLGNIKSPEDLEKVVSQMQEIAVKTNGGTDALRAFLKPLAQLIELSSQAKQSLDANSKSTNQLTTAQQNLLDQTSQALRYSKLDGAERAKAIALDKAHAAGLSETNAAQKPVIENLVREAEETYNNTQSQKQLSQQRTKSNTAANQQARAEESVAQKLDQLRQQSDLNAVSSQNLTLEQTKLRAEMSLGKNATAAQREEAAKYAEAIWQQAAALKARNLIPEVAENDDYQRKTSQIELLKGQRDSQGNLIISQQQYQQESEKLAAEHIGNLAKINSQNAVTPQQSLAGLVDPVQQLANENAQKLELIKQFVGQRVITEQQGLTLINAANTAYEKQRTDAQWALFTQQSTGYQALGAAVDGFGQSASSALTGVITGSENLASALQNIGNTVLNSVVQTFVEMGLQWVKSAIMGSVAQETASAQAAAAQAAGIAAVIPATVAAATTSATAWAPAALSASIATLGSASAAGSAAYTTAMASSNLLSIAGARKNGGPVNGNAIYQVGESGLPEIFKASNGSQYMIPGDNGRVISNREMNSGQGNSSGGVNQTIHFNIQTTGGIDDATMAKMSQMMQQVSLSTIRNEQRPNGMLARSR